MKVCGPKLSLCGLIISVWGIIQLETITVSTCTGPGMELLSPALYMAAGEENDVYTAARYYQKFTCLQVVLFDVFMGIFYQVKSVALAEDLPHIHEATFATVEEFYTEADKGYSLNAYNCWIAACLYVFTLIISGHQFYVNSRSSLSM